MLYDRIHTCLAGWAAWPAGWLGSNGSLQYIRKDDDPNSTAIHSNVDNTHAIRWITPHCFAWHSTEREYFRLNDHWGPMGAAMGVRTSMCNSISIQTHEGMIGGIQRGMHEDMHGSSQGAPQSPA